jgi:hypothetical protein
MPPPVPGGLLGLDSSITASMKNGGVTVVDGQNVDTWNTIATQAVVGLQPFYDAKNLSNAPAVVFGGPGGNAGAGLSQFVTTYLNLAAFAWGIPFTLVMLFRANGAGALVELSADVTANPGLLLTSTSQWAMRVRNAGGTQDADSSQGLLWTADNKTRWIAITHDGTTLSLYINGVLDAAAVFGPAPGVGAIVQNATIGASHGGGSTPFGWSLGYLDLWNHVFSPAEMAQQGAYLTSIWRLTNLVERQRYNVVSIGDSIPGGAGLVSTVNGRLNEPFAFANRACNKLGFRFGTPYVLSYSGQPLSVIITGWNTSGPNGLVAGVKNIVFVEGGLGTLNSWPGGIIDGASQAAAAAQCTSDMHTLITDIVTALGAVAGGPHNVFVHTMTSESAPNAPPFWYNARNTYNANVIAQAPGWGTVSAPVVVVDVGADNYLGNAANFPPTVTQFVQVSGGIHPTQAGHDRWSGYDIAALIAAGL